MVSDRDLTTTRTQVFGDVEKGTECRVCGRPVEDGRRKTCSVYCNNLLVAVMGMLNWNAVRRRVKERDDNTCQNCGWSLDLERRARDHIRDIIDEKAGERPESPRPARLSEPEEIENFDFDDHYDRMQEWRERREELKERYGDPFQRSRRLEVDHIQPISRGGHPFDPGNLQTLCGRCHRDKTADDLGGTSTPAAEELNESLFNYVGGDDAE